MKFEDWEIITKNHLDNMGIRSIITNVFPERWQIIDIDFNKENGDVTLINLDNTRLMKIISWNDLESNWFLNIEEFK